MIYSFEMFFYQADLIYHIFSPYGARTDAILSGLKDFYRDMNAPFLSLGDAKEKGLVTTDEGEKIENPAFGGG